MSKLINIYNDKGTLIDSVPLKTNLVRLENRRVSIGEDGLYYKGAGILYKTHNVQELDPYIHNNYIMNKDIVYGGYIVSDSRYEGLDGIICSRYQPYFRDYIGGCGPKESKIVENSKSFQYSGVNVVDSISILDQHKIYICNYKASKGFENKSPDAIDVAKILYYISNTDWCCPWDKNTYRDIDGKGLLRDPADWFHSGKFEDKLGTLYSILYPMFQYDIGLYNRVVEYIGLRDIPLTLFTIPYICLLILYKTGYKSIPSKLRGKYDMKLYIDIMISYLFKAKYCCQLDIIDDRYSNVEELMIKKFYKDIGGK